MFGRESDGAGASKRHEVILVALEDRFSLARIPSLLYRSGCRVTVLGDPKAAVSASRFVERLVPCRVDPASAAEALGRLIGSYVQTLPWVILGDELALQAGIFCREQSWLQEIFPVDPWKSADVIFRKAAFMTAAAAAGIPIPPMRVCRSRAEALTAAQRLEFPLFFKRDVDCAGAGVRQIVDIADVGPAYDQLSDTGPVVVQQMIHGRVGKTNMLYSRGRLMCHTSAYAKRTWPGKFGPSCIREYFCDDRLEQIAAAIGAMTGFNGLCGFDWIQDDRTGQFFVIEFNGRAIATYHLGKHVGVSYERAVRDFLAGAFTVQHPRLITGTKPVIYMFPQDVRRCITDLDVVGLGKWLVGGVTTDMPWGDANLILFFFFEFARLGYKRVSRFIRRRRRRAEAAEKSGVTEVHSALSL
jgi:predicted ATP-grasp superfamily ATP-dependent carboligase